MKHALLFIALSFSIVNAQTVVNGSFETNSAGICQFDLSNASFNTYFTSATGFGTNGRLQIISHSACPTYGTAQNGNWFIALTALNTNYDAVALQLTAPLNAGTHYQLTFYGKKDVVTDANPLWVGYSTTNNAFGTLIDSFPADPTSWTPHTVIFVPSVAATYITLQVKPLVFGWDFVDNFTIGFPTEIENISEPNWGFNIFPNPAHDYLNFSAAQNISVVNIIDASGRSVLNESVSLDQNQIDIHAFIPGFYVLEATDERGMKIRKSFLIQ